MSNELVKEVLEKMKIGTTFFFVSMSFCIAYFCDKIWIEKFQVLRRSEMTLY